MVGAVDRCAAPPPYYGQERVVLLCVPCSTSDPLPLQGVPWVSCWGPPVCHDIQGDIATKRHLCTCVVLASLCRCGCAARVVMLTRLCVSANKFRNASKSSCLLFLVLAALQIQFSATSTFYVLRGLHSFRTKLWFAHLMSFSEDHAVFAKSVCVFDGDGQACLQTHKTSVFTCRFSVFIDAGEDAPYQRDLTCASASVTTKGRENNLTHLQHEGKNQSTR